MKHNLQGITVPSRIGAMLLILTIVLVSSGAASQSSSQNPVRNTPTSQAVIAKYLAVQQNADLGEEEKIKAVIDAYFTIRYEGQKSITEQDFSSLVEDNTYEWVKKERDKREIELYIASLFNLGYESYMFTIDYDTIDIKDQEAVVQLNQSHQVIYKAVAPQVSELSGLPHIITLHNSGGIWVIYKDEYHDEYTKLLGTATKEEIKQQVDENYNYSKVIANKNDPNALLSTTEALPSYYSSYNRTAAVTFADAHALQSTSPAPIPQAIKDAYQATYGSPYPSSWPQVYRVEPDNDCTNFISQAIFEGTGYTSGDTNYFYPYPNDDNWYYKFAPNYPPPAQGPVTWKRAGAPTGSSAGLYDFLINTNTAKRGPFGVPISSSSLCTGISAGDPIFMKSGSTWAHAVIVSFVVPPCYAPNNILVDSHTSYYKRTPLTTYSGFSWYGVHIQGYIETPFIFEDVPPTHWAWPEIERLYNNQITAGCYTNPLRYCPDNIVKRSEMAVFLLRGIHGYSYSPPPVGSSTGFADVPTTHWAATWIKQLYAEGITGGCAIDPLRYCPEDPSTHAQMAVFLLRSKYGASYTPPPVGGSTGFYDVATNYWAAAWIKQLAAEGISYGAHGCGTGYYCPENQVTRAEMAGMLLRAFNLP